MATNCSGSGSASIIKSPSPNDAALLCSISSAASTPTAGNVSIIKESGDSSSSGASIMAAAPLSSEVGSSGGVNNNNNNKPLGQQQQQQQQYVDHTYTDYAQVVEDDLRLMKEATAGVSSRGILMATDGMLKSKGSTMMPFPGKLLEVLDRGDLTSIIDWMPHGRAFIVKQPKVFTTQVLPRFFKQTKFLSFTRQLNLWGFKRITRGLDSGAYYHELFLPGRPNLVMRMKRVKIKGTGIRPIPNPEKEPNFYYEYPHVARVPRSNVPIPLPPLPSERIATLMGNRGPTFVAQVHELREVERQARTSEPAAAAAQAAAAAGLGRGFHRPHPPPRQPPSDQHLKGLANLAVNLSNHGQRTHGSSLSMNSMGGGAAAGRLGGMRYSNDNNIGLNPSSVAPLVPSKNTVSAAAAAERRLQGSIASSTFSETMNNLYSRNGTSGSSGGLPPRLPTARYGNLAYEPASPAPRGGLDAASNMYIRPASMSNNTMAPPRDFAPNLHDDDDDEVSKANRRLMERLLDQTTSAPAPRDMMLRRGSASLLGGHSHRPQQPAGAHHERVVRRESFKLHPGAHGTAPPTATTSSLYPRDFGRYMNHHHHHGAPRSSSLPSSTMPPSMASAGLSSSRHQEINVSTVTNALREAQHLEELARSQRDAARALAGALRQRMGGQDITLPLGQDYNNYEDPRGEQR